MTNPTVRLVDEADFAALLDGFPDRDHQVAAPYVDAITRLRGEQVERVAIHDGLEVVSLAVVRIRKVPTLGGVGLVAGGPLVAADGAADRMHHHRLAMEALTEEYTSRGIRLHVRPPVMPTVSGWLDPAVEIGAGVQPSPLFDPYRTMVIDLDRSDDERRAALSMGWRRHLRESERASLQYVEGPIGETWAQMRPMYDEMVERKGFHAELPPEFWTEVFAADDADRHFRGVLVQQRGRNLAGAIMGGDANITTFLLGATTHAALPLRAGYLAMWAAISLAKRTGNRVFDLGGVDRERNPGGWQFKHGLRGREIVTPHPVVATPANRRGAALAMSERVALAWRARRRT